MAEMFEPLAIPRSFLTDMPTATLNAGMALMSRRSSALAQYWRSFAEVREPTELMAVQLNYWTQLVDDYQEAISQGISQMGSGEPQTQPEPAPATRPGPAAHTA